MKKYYLFLAFIIWSAGLCAQVKYDTLDNRFIAPGVQYNKLYCAGSKWVVNILKVELKNPNVMIETAKGLNTVSTFKDKVTLVGQTPVELLSMMALENTYDEHTVVGGINGDFFTEEGRPYNLQIMKSQLLQAFPKDNAYYPKGTTIGFDKNNKPMLGRIEYSGNLTVKKRTPVVHDSTIVIDGINAFRGADQMWIYNQFVGSEGPDYLPWSGQNQWAPEILVEPIDPYVINGPVRGIIRGLKPCGKDTTFRFAKDCFLLSQHRNADDWLMPVMSLGDTVRINLEIKPGVKNPCELIGGSPQIVKNGAKYVDQGYLDEDVIIDPNKSHHSKELHARSAVGISQDSTYMYMVTVDKNDKSTPASVGMTLDQMADLMISLGASNALNLNGAENSTLFAGEAVVNSPTLGEIPVSNALLIAVKSTDATSVKNRTVPPAEYTLYQNYPNPFNPATKICFYLKSVSNVSLKIYNLLGQEIAVLVSGNLHSGTQTVNFDASHLTSGIYICKLEVRGTDGKYFTGSKKMSLVK